MNFATLSPAERLKASALVGLIVVLLFFIVHTVLGAIGKKPQTASMPPNKPAASQTPAPAAPVNPDGEPAKNGEAFPMGKATAAVSDIANDPDLRLEIADPFEPARSPKPKKEETPSQPAVSVVSAGSPDPLRERGHISPTLFPFGQSPNLDYTKLAPGRFGPGPGESGGATSPSVETVLPPPPPEIRLIGVIEGTPSVATLSIAGRVRVARPGDALVRGWRLMSISSDEVNIRHNGEFISLRVGGILNEAPSKS